MFRQTIYAAHRLLCWAILKLITGYQWLVSPFLGQCCRFYPSCSAYAKEAILQHGALKGTYLMCRRVLRCHPLNPGGIDPVPNCSRKTDGF